MNAGRHQNNLDFRRFKLLNFLNLDPLFIPCRHAFPGEIITFHSMLVSSVRKCRALNLKMIVVGFGWGGILSFEDFEIQRAVVAIQDNILNRSL